MPAFSNQFTIFSCYVAVFLLASFLLGCTGQPTQNEQTLEERNNLPTTCEGAAKEIYTKLDEDSIKTLSETEKSDLIMFHLSWGMGIRNSYGLWDEGSQIRRSCAEMVGEEDIHPDSASSVIMELVWESVHSAT